LPNRVSRAFTLIELLVVIAIIAILAAILFPVFAQAKQAAKKTKAISNMKQGVLASLMYMNDYDDGYPMADSGCVTSDPRCEGWGFGPPDTVPFQVQQPYEKNTEFVIDPMDPWQSEQQRIADQCPYMVGCTLATITPDQRAYALGTRSNMGYNFAFFSPWIYKAVPGGEYLGSGSVNASQVTQPAHTLMFGTSIWNRTPGGAPTQGGNWVVQTPCWNDANGNLLPPMNQYTSYSGSGQYFNYGVGWDSNPLSWIVYGGLWPFYAQTSSTAADGAQNGQVVIGWADGHTKAMPISQVAAGCAAYGASGGIAQSRVTDTTKFIWATQQ
jgi:prepilin-type N-terminal cleavage/methylation domain-containing protein